MVQNIHLLILSILVAGITCRGCFDADDKEISGQCYKFVNQKLTFEDARDWCHYKNPITPSYLAYMHNQFVANFVATYARTAFGSNDAVFWIGLSRERNWMPWTWDNGYQLGQSWSNFDDQIKQNYVVERVSNAKWTTVPDNSTNYFVCSYDPTDPPVFAPPTSSKSTTTTTTTTTTRGPTTTALKGTGTPPPSPTAEPQELTNTLPSTSTAPTFKRNRNSNAIQSSRTLNSHQNIVQFCVL